MRKTETQCRVGIRNIEKIKLKIVHGFMGQTVITLCFDLFGEPAQLISNRKSMSYVFDVQERVVQKAVSANLGLKFNRLFILVCSA